jgi:hypothetical protein
MDEDFRQAPGASTPAPRSGGLQVFEVRVTGLVSEDVLHELADVEISSRELRTSLRGTFRDQAELHGFLAKLRAFGLDVVEVHRLATDTPAAEEAAGGVESS